MKALDKIIISNIKMPVKHTEAEVFEKAKKSAERKGISVFEPVIHKKSIDARRKSDIHFVYSVVFSARGVRESALSGDIGRFCEPEGISFDSFKRNIQKNKKIVIAGSGPCGLFSALVLAKCGFSPLIIERGEDVEKRSKAVEAFFNGGELDENTNIQFGEGGAGTFSDGKLNTRIGSPLQRFILETFVECGAPSDILYQAKPHIGTDFLAECVKNIRGEIIKCGGTVRFGARLSDIIIKNGKVCEIEINSSEREACDCLILATGHSGRDTYEMLLRRGAIMQQKPFAAGVRIEHKREFINAAQYGLSPEAKLLPAADYRLVYNGSNRSCYSFCMCPGGVVVNASSEKGGLVVNGMSRHSRSEENSNSALAVTVRPEDFENDSPLAGIEFQRKYERAAFALAGGKGIIQLARDFADNRESTRFGEVKPSFTGDTEFANIKEALPSFISETLTEGLGCFERKIKGFLSGDALLTGVEMRTSAPVRVLRNENFESLNIKGLFPAGEGAGYAGGIMSAAIDGVKIAESIIKSV